MSNETVTDIDGNVYTTVKIGNQIWTVENLRTTKYNDGTPIPNVKDDAEWSKLKTGAYCYSSDEAQNIEREGALYNWYAVNDGKLAPEGWRVPTDEDWDTLKSFLISSGYNADGSREGNKIGKAVAVDDVWSDEFYEHPDKRDDDDKNVDEENAHLSDTVGYDIETNNDSGFTGYPAGYRGENGNVEGHEFVGGWWSTTEHSESEGTAHCIHFLREDFDKTKSDKRYGASVRLVKNAD